MLKALVTADRNWAIGKNGQHITVIPDDERYIRQTTTGQTVIMGRKTFESIITAHIPTNRTNIVLSLDPSFKATGQDNIVCKSVDAALSKAKELGTDCYILGGASIYRQFLPFLDEAEVTFVDYSYDADAFFPNLDKLPEWVLLEESEELTHFDTVYHIRKYARRKDYRG